MLLGSEKERDNQLSDSQIADNIIGVIFAAHDTTASVLTWVLKYLHDNNDVLEAVTVSFIRFLLYSFTLILYCSPLIPNFSLVQSRC